MMPKDNVLFLCTGNTCRSQMAEAFLRFYAGSRYDVHSAGLESSIINPMTYQVMAELGLNLVGQYSKSIHTYLGKVKFDYLITVCDDAEKNCPIWPGAINRLHWSFEDPAKFEGSDAEKLNKFRTVRDQIKTRVIEWIS
jgi:arsenate reductase (thioredoxin)